MNGVVVKSICCNCNWVFLVLRWSLANRISFSHFEAEHFTPLLPMMCACTCSKNSGYEKYEWKTFLVDKKRNRFHPNIFQLQVLNFEKRLTFRIITKLFLEGVKPKQN